MDITIYRKAVKGDKHAFEEIVDEYYKDVYVFALGITGNVHDAMDVCQDSFIKAYHNLRKLKEVEKFKSWLFKITSNTAKDVFRRRKPEDFKSEDLKQVFSEESLVQKLDLLSALMKLKTEYRQVLILKYFNDLKTKDIARIIKIPENTVKSRIRYALDQIKTVMEEN